MDIENQIEQVEITIEQAKEKVTQKSSLDKLLSNKDFIDIILVGYFKNEASAMALMLGNPATQTEVDQTRIIKNIEGIGRLNNYFSSIMQLGHIAEKTIKEHEELRSELLKEEVA